jgi:hypothetical protein
MIVEIHLMIIPSVDDVRLMFAPTANLGWGSIISTANAVRHAKQIRDVAANIRYPARSYS